MLAGLRVLDLGVIVVGADTGRMFADEGADVIKIESRAFPDGSRQAMGDGPMAPSFAWGHRNKRSLGLDLRSDEGKKLFLALAEHSDLVLSNFRPGTMESLGLGYAELSRVNPGIVMVDSSALGSTGPESRSMGYGPLVRASTGLTTLWRYPDQPDGFCDSVTIYPDHTSARIGAVGALAMLMRRGGGRPGRDGERGSGRGHAQPVRPGVPGRIAAAGLDDGARQRRPGRRAVRGLPVRRRGPVVRHHRPR